MSRRNLLGGLVVAPFLPVTTRIPIADNGFAEQPEPGFPRETAMMLYSEEDEQLLCETGEPLSWRAT